MGLLTAAGSGFTCDVHVVHLHDESHYDDRTLLVLVDQGTEIALRESEQRFRDFSNSSADWFWEMNTELRFSYLSENFRSTFGLDPQQVLGRTRRELLIKNDLNAVDAVSAHLDLLDRHEPFRGYQYRVRDESGDIRWISISGLPVFGADGRFAGYRGVGQNITAHERLEQAAAENQQRMEFALAGAEMGMWDLDIASGRLSHDARLVTMLGYEIGEIEVGKAAFLALRHPDDAARFDSAFVAHLKGETPIFEVEWRIRHRKQHWVWSATPTTGRCG